MNLRRFFWFLKSKETLKGKYVKFSIETAMNNPIMILREYDRTIEQIECTKKYVLAKTIRPSIRNKYPNPEDVMLLTSEDFVEWLASTDDLWFDIVKVVEKSNKKIKKIKEEKEWFIKQFGDK